MRPSLPLHRARVAGCSGHAQPALVLPLGLFVLAGVACSRGDDLLWQLLGAVGKSSGKGQPRGFCDRGTAPKKMPAGKKGGRSKAPARKARKHKASESNAEGSEASETEASDQASMQEAASVSEEVSDYRAMVLGSLLRLLRLTPSAHSVASGEQGHPLFV